MAWAGALWTAPHWTCLLKLPHVLRRGNQLGIDAPDGAGEWTGRPLRNCRHIENEFSFSCMLCARRDSGSCSRLSSPQHGRRSSLASGSSGIPWAPHRDRNFSPGLTCCVPILQSFHRVAGDAYRRHLSRAQSYFWYCRFPGNCHDGRSSWMGLQWKCCNCFLCGSDCLDTLPSPPSMGISAGSVLGDDTGPPTIAHWSKKFRYADRSRSFRNRPCSSYQLRGWSTVCTLLYNPSNSYACTLRSSLKLQHEPASGIRRGNGPGRNRMDRRDGATAPPTGSPDPLFAGMRIPPPSGTLYSPLDAW